MKDGIVEFLRKRDYVLVRELGQGACGKTVLLHDDVLDEDYVCKKYSPYSETHRSSLYRAFVREIRLLHRIYHPNVVRLYNCYLYPDQQAGFILMEYVEGFTIDEFLRRAPEKINELFLQTLDGFRYLEANKILHRDIRPPNLLVRDDGVPKIIDLGFGKQVEMTADFDKSISLNWWCAPPKEFENSIYDFRTEVYFVGKLFEKIIVEVGIEEFQHRDLLRGMCEHDPEARVQSFFDIEKTTQNDRFFEMHFTEDEMDSYRVMADALEKHIKKVQHDGKYKGDIEQIIAQLETAYRNCLLEETVPDAVHITRCFMDGNYRYQKKGFPVNVVRDFLHLLKVAPPAKRRTIMANLHTRLDAIDRYTWVPDEDIPF